MSADDRTAVELDELEAAFAAEAADGPPSRNGLAWLRPAAVSAIAVLLAVYLQVALAIDTRILGALPDLVMIVLVGVALRFGPVWGAAAGFLAGLVIDVALQRPLGASALVLTPIGWMVGVFAATRRRVSLAMTLLVLVVAVAVQDVADVLLDSLVIGDPLVWRSALIRGVAEIMLTVLVGIPMLVLLRRLIGVPEGAR